MCDYSDGYLRTILGRMSTIAMVGLSTNELRPSFFVGRYLSRRGFRVIGVNPGAAGQTLFGQTIVADLSEIDAGVDMVDIFRRSDAVLGIVDAALRDCTGLRTVWMQIGVRNPQAAEAARASGVDVVQDRCTKIEHQRLFGELRKGGFATGVISSRL
ncbi:MAG: CoA-binding protein [Marinibacterium sp.]